MQPWLKNISKPLFSSVEEYTYFYFSISIAAIAAASYLCATLTFMILSSSSGLGIRLFVASLLTCGAVGGCSFAVLQAFKELLFNNEAKIVYRQKLSLAEEVDILVQDINRSAYTPQFFAENRQ